MAAQVDEAATMRLIVQMLAEDIEAFQDCDGGSTNVFQRLSPTSSTTSRPSSVTQEEIDEYFELVKDLELAYAIAAADQIAQFDAVYARKLQSLELSGAGTIDGTHAQNIYGLFQRSEVDAVWADVVSKNPNRVQSPSVASMESRTYAHNDPRKIVTTFRIEQWESTLASLGLLDKHREVLNLVRTGFPLGVEWNLRNRIVHSHHSSATRHPQVIRDYIAKEEAAGRYSAPYRPDELERLIGPFYCAPLGTKDKVDKPEEKRVIHDNTYPGDGHSKALNTHVIAQKDAYSWTTFAQMAQLVIEAPGGSQACVFDGESAYRMCPTRPQDQRFTCIEWEGLVRVDRAPHFGGKNAGVPHGQMADILHDIIRAKWKNARAAKWQDDHVIIQEPLNNPRLPTWAYYSARPTMSFTLGDIVALADRLGYQTKREKDQPFSTEFTYIGFEWSLANRTVQLKVARRTAYIAQITEILTRRHAAMSINEIAELAGRLTHSSSAFMEGKAHLRSFYDELSTRGGYQTRGGINDVQNPTQPRTKADLVWWQNALRASVPMPLRNIPVPSPDWVIYVDASSDWGCGVVINNGWDHWKFVDDWTRGGERSIGWAEGVAVELAVHALFTSYRIPVNTHIRIWCDNQGFVGAWKKGSSRNPEQNALVIAILRTMVEKECHLTLEYIPTGKNLADPPSRGSPAQSCIRHRWSTSPLPENLRGVFESR